MQGVAVAVAGLALIVTGHAIRPWLLGLFVDFAGLIVLLGYALAAARSRISHVRQVDVRISLWSAWWAVALGTVIITIAVGISASTGRAAAGQYIGAAGFNVLLLSPYIASAVYVLVAAVIRVGVRTVIVALGVLLLSVVLLPPSVVSLANGGSWPTRYLLGPQSNSTLVDLLPLVPPVALVVVPEMMRHGRLTWKAMAELDRKVVLTWLTRIAVLATCLYAVLLHFWGGPAAGTPINKIAMAVLPLGLGVLYKRIAASCWQSGIAKTILHDWRADQQSVLHDIRNLYRPSAGKKSQ